MKIILKYNDFGLDYRLVNINGKAELQVQMNGIWQKSEFGETLQPLFEATLDLAEVMDEIVKITEANECDEVDGSMIIETIQSYVDKSQALEVAKEALEIISKIENDNHCDDCSRPEEIPCNKFTRCLQPNIYAEQALQKINELTGNE